MDCHKHPEREAVSSCTICGKNLCQECSVEIAGKSYCKDCLEQIVGFGASNEQKTEVNEDNSQQTPIKDTINEYDFEEENYGQSTINFKEDNISTEEPSQYTFKKERSDNNYSIDDKLFENEETNIYEFDGFDNESSENKEDSKFSSEEKLFESPYNEVNFPEANDESYNAIENNQKINDYRNQNIYENEEDYSYLNSDAPMPEFEPYDEEAEFIYPDHSYQPEERSSRQALEDKYEHYLDDLYFDEPEVPLSEQLAKDEEKYGSIIDEPYVPNETRKYKDTSYDAYEEEIITGEPYNNYGTLDQQIHNDNQLMKDELPEEMPKRLDPVTAEPQTYKEQPQFTHESYTPQQEYQRQDVNYQQQSYTQEPQEVNYQQGYTQEPQYQPQEVSYSQGYVESNHTQQGYIEKTAPIYRENGPIRNDAEYAAIEEQIRQNIAKSKTKPSTKSIHNIENYKKNGKEPVGIVDIILTVILVILILIVIFYIVYIFMLSSSYPTFIDAIYGLTDPQTFFNNLLGN